MLYIYILLNTAISSDITEYYIARKIINQNLQLSELMYSCYMKDSMMNV